MNILALLITVLIPTVHINNETNLMKASVVCLCSDAHPWLRARCQQTSREPQKRSSEPREYPEPHLKPVGKSALHLFMIVYRRRENPERVEFVHFFWLARRGQKSREDVGCGCEGCNEFPRPHYPQFGCRQASTSPSVSPELRFPPCFCAFCTHSTEFLLSVPPLLLGSHAA